MNKIMNAVSSLALLAMAAIPLAAIGSVAHAAEHREAGIAVRVGDLHLDRSADAAAFQNRVDVAGRRLCSDATVSRIVQPACLRAVREEAIAKLSAEQRHDFELAMSAPALQTVAAR